MKRPGEKLAAILVAVILALGTARAGESPRPMDLALPNHWAVIHVVLAQPLPIKGEPGTVVGYYQSLGVASEAARLRVVVEHHVRDGIVDWSDSEVRRVDLKDLEEKIRSQITPVSGEGIWYRSGRSFHGPE